MQDAFTSQQVSQWNTPKKKHKERHADGRAGTPVGAKAQNKFRQRLRDGNESPWPSKVESLQQRIGSVPRSVSELTGLAYGLNNNTTTQQSKNTTTRVAECSLVDLPAPTRCAIYVPDVLVLKDDEDVDIDTPFPISIVYATAPMKSDTETYRNRITSPPTSHMWTARGRVTCRDDPSRKLARCYKMSFMRSS